MAPLNGNTQGTSHGATNITHGTQMAKLSPEERRRLKQKLRKAASKQAKADAQAKEAETQKRVEQAKGPKKTADGEKKKCAMTAVALHALMW